MLRIISFFFLASLLFSCKREKETYCTDTVITDEISISIDYASNFDLVKTNVGYSLEILNPENGEVEKRISIHQNDSSKIISLSATLNGMIAILAAQNRLIGIDNEQYIYDTLILSNLHSGKTQSFGNESNTSLEKIIASGANLIFYNGFGEKFPNEEKLQKLGIKVIPIYDWRENHPLGKAEWIKLIGIITGKEKEAINYFEHVSNEYLNLLSITDTLNSKPNVLVGSLYGDIWYAPGGEGYFAQLLKDAGANYVYHETKGSASQAYSMEKIIKDNIDTKFWINPGLPTKAEILKSNPKARYLKALSTNCYGYASQMNKFWEQSAAMPHLVLKDLVKIFHSDVTNEDEFYFYKKVN